jgi:hypothetical protein
MGGGITLPVFSFVPGILVEFPSLTAFTFSIGKSQGGGNKLFVATG